MTNSHNSKWNNILSRMVITTIPFKYVSKITIYSNNKVYIAKTKEEYQKVIMEIVKTSNLKSNYLSLLSISFDVDFNTRKFKKEVRNRVDTLFSKFFKS